jgi:hypothetical protein
MALGKRAAAKAPGGSAKHKVSFPSRASEVLVNNKGRNLALHQHATTTTAASPVQHQQMRLAKPTSTPVSFWDASSRTCL